MTAWSRVVARFGTPHVDVWSPTEYRVWVQTGWHVHSGASTSDPVGQGRSLESACKALLVYTDRPGSLVVVGECDYQCRRRYDASAASKVAYSGLKKVLDEAAARVAAWPAWKQGLPPCAREECDREYDHPGRHRRPRKGV